MEDGNKSKENKDIEPLLSNESASSRSCETVGQIEYDRALFQEQNKNSEIFICGNGDTSHSVWIPKRRRWRRKMTLCPGGECSNAS